MAKQRLGSATLPPPRLNDAPPGGDPPEPPEPPAPIAPQIFASFPHIDVLAKGPVATNGFSWEDLDLVSLPTFDADFGVASFNDARFGNAGTARWESPVGNPGSIPDTVTVEVTDDTGLTDEVSFTVTVHIGPAVAVDAGKEQQTFTEGDAANVTGVWLSLEMVPNSKDVSFEIIPNNGSFSFDDIPFLFINGTWELDFPAIALTDAGEYKIVMTDGANGFQSEAVFSIGVDAAVPNVPPTIEIDVADQGPIFKIAGETVTINGDWTNTDTDGPVSIVEFGSSIGSVNVDNPSTAGDSWDWSSGVLVEGSYTIQFKITDATGDEDDVFLDLIVNPAELTLTGSPLTFSVAEGAVVTCDLNWTDSDGIDTGSGVAAYEITPIGFGSIDALGSGTSGSNIWTSPALTNAEHDGLLASITLRDANGNAANVDLSFSVQAPAVDVPPTIEAALLQNDPWGIADKVAFLEIGAPGVFQGTWTDGDASVPEPVAEITAISNQTFAAFGTIDPLPGSPAFDTTSGAWQVSSSNHNFGDNGSIVTLVITDFDSQTDELTVRIDLGVDDNPLREIPGHPEPTVSLWGFLNSNLNWTSDPRAVALGAGYVLQNQFWSAGSQAEWGVVSSINGRSMHVYRPQFTAHLPDDTTHIEVRAYATLGAAPEELVQQHRIDGPLTPSAIDDYTITLQDIDITAEGDSARIVMWTELDGHFGIVQPQETAGLLENSFFERDPENIIPPQNGLEIWRFEPNRIEQAVWDAHVVEGPDFNLVASNRLQATGGNNRLRMLLTNNWVRFPPKYIAPIRLPTGVIRCFNSLDSPDGHCMIQPYASGGVLQSSAYTELGQAYEWDSVLDMPPGFNWAAAAFGIVMQLHPGSFPGGFATANPIIDIQIGSSGVDWIGHANGDPAVSPTDYSTRFIRQKTFEPGLQTIKLEFRLDPLSAFGGSYCRMTVNGDTFLDTADDPSAVIGINHSGLGAGNSGAFMSTGYYGGTPNQQQNPALQPYVDIQYSRLAEV